MKQPDHENEHAPLSYHGAWRIVWLVVLLVIIWLILRSLQPVILLFAVVFLLAMVLNPIVVWLHKCHVPRSSTLSSTNFICDRANPITPRSIAKQPRWSKARTDLPGTNRAFLSPSEVESLL
jgi:hypothetical protein